MANIIQLYSNNDSFTKLVIDMRKVMQTLNQAEKATSILAARKEAESYLSDNHKVFVYQFNEELVAYSVIKIEDQVCWLDWLYLKPEYRGTSVASDLFDHAETFAKELGNDQLYIWVHPDNQPMLKFLKKKGYDVLNLIEVKKEKPKSTYKIDIFDNKFRY
jgi:GNAT superfamily N-acetyltransferase